MKVNTKLEMPKQQVMAPSRSLPRSASELADPPSPFSSNPAHHPVSVPTTPGLSCSSFGRMMQSPPTDTPTKQQQQGAGNNKPKPTPVAAAAAYYASLWSPRRLMQRAARAFRRSRSRGHVRTVKDLAEERASVLNGSSHKVSDEAAVLPVAGAEASIGNGARNEQQRHDEYHHEIVPEKIIREDAPPAPVVAEAKETAAAAAFTEVEVESPKKGGAAPAPEAIVAATVEDDVVADKFVTVVKEAIKKHEAAEKDEKKEAMRRFQGSRVKTAMEARPESEQPRRREVARSNDVIEEARTKLLEKRQCSRVKALVGAFETVMDTNKDAAVAAGAKPRHHYRKSA